MRVWQPRALCEYEGDERTGAGRWRLRCGGRGPHTVPVCEEQREQRHVLCHRTLLQFQRLRGHWNRSGPGPEPGPHALHFRFKSLIVPCLLIVLSILSHIIPHAPTTGSPGLPPGSPPLPISPTLPPAPADETQCDWNAELEVLLMLENGVELLLERSKAWLVYTKAFSSHVEKRTTLGT